jgi:hypothetical protein
MERHKERNVILTSSVIHKRNPLDPLQYAEYRPVKLLLDEESINDPISDDDYVASPVIDTHTQNELERIEEEKSGQLIGDEDIPFEPVNP